MRGGGLKTTHRGSPPSFSSDKKKEGEKKREAHESNKLTIVDKRRD